MFFEWEVWFNVFKGLSCLCLSCPLPLILFFTEKYSELYCLSFNPSVNKEEREESWNFIDLVSDYKRMGVPNNLWVMTAANSEYRVSLWFKDNTTNFSGTGQILVHIQRFAKSDLWETTHMKIKVSRLNSFDLISVLWCSKYSTPQPHTYNNRFVLWHIRIWHNQTWSDVL